MRDSFEVDSSSGSYSVVSDTGLLAGAVDNNPSAIFLIDARLKQHLSTGAIRKIEIEANEDSKSLECIPRIIGKLREFGANRTSHLIAIGGGTIQDIAAFSASIYMRGIPWTYMPTTMLGMTDSCIGGKSAINVLGYKNLVGNFHPPAQVLIDLKFIESLNAEQMVAGLFEAVKICYARGYQAFQDYLSDSPGASMNPLDAQRTIMHSLRTKKWFIEIDEFDQNERLLLNFGHSFGHALEAGTGFRVSHGIAVGIGMLVSIEYANMQSRMSSAGRSVTEQLRNYIRSLLGESDARVVEPPPPIDISLVMEKFEGDKKHLSDVYRIIVPKANGALTVASKPRNQFVQGDIATAYEHVFAEIGWDVVSAIK
ncbi:MAG: 3-dehydroquinate synthase [Rhodocyclaceae bacterium]|nr:MAG: 3-dehydroquinate synthase [Rhodocyclaceae bacterium]